MVVELTSTTHVCIAIALLPMNKYKRKDYVPCALSIYKLNVATKFNINT